MADNIKIVGNVNNTQRISRFKTVDTNLLSIDNLPQNFGYDGDFIELFIYDENNNILSVNYNYTDFKLPPNQFLYPDNTLPIIQIDPPQDIQNIGYNNGLFKSQYSFFRRRFSSSNDDLFITEISQDRTEIRVNSVNLSSSELINEAQKIINEFTSSSYQKYYVVNLDVDIQQIAVNVAIDNTTDIPSILFKLYEPLPTSIIEKDTLWITEEITEPYVFGINLDLSIIPEPLPQLKGPNFDINIDIKQNLGTKYENYSSLVSSLTGSSYRQVLNYMNDNSYDLNIDYTSFENFIHFSSAKKRLEIFYSKVKQIEDYNNNINLLTGSASNTKNTETSSIKLKIDNIVKYFDGFENYLYYESSSYTWPKTNNIKPYILSSTSSINIWYNNYTSSANNYDDSNLDYLHNTLPEYIKNDSGNYQPYYTFIDMIGHYFDNIWIYITSINELYNADNNLEKGVSKDIIYDALKSLGVKLYNSKGDNNFEDYIGGINSGSTLFLNDFSATSSYLNNIPKKDLLAETYKRIYHNLILLNKNKGTVTGLQNFITSFGITSSIFSPNEFGGSNKKNQLKGYDNDKITIQNNTITGSVLSPFISLQQPFTTSSDFTSTDLHFVDLSFSPQNELNSRVSASVAVTYPTFSLDEYIGDPRLMTSSSYDDLITQQNYFISASSAASGSAKRLDYKGFIELVKYFDNSLFKMLKDFVPARTNALTGITIKSPSLERNKVPIYHPKVTKETIYDAKYSGPTITEDKTYHYNKITNNKSSFYTGDFTGSYININDVFENSNPNPYLHPTNSINVNQFNHTDFNVTLNNISSSVTSNSRKKLEKIYVTSNNNVFLSSSINEYTSDAELQESNLSSKGFQNSRYDGTKISSLKLNTYSSSSNAYSGDNSYGKTAVIDHNTRKIGLFYQISTNPYFNYPSRNNVFIKYLVDENGNLTELNKKNKNWNEVQNIFKSGELLAVAQFDNSRDSGIVKTSQKFTDGNKPIYDSGYSYFPIIYASSLDEKLYFNYTGDTKSKLFRIVTSGGFISGSSSNKYPISSGKIFNLFQKGTDITDTEFSDGNTFYKTSGSLSMFSTYSIQETSKQQFNANFSVNVEFPSINLSGSFTFNINKVGTLTPLASQSLFIASGKSTIKYTDYKYFKADYSPSFLFIDVETKIYNTDGTLSNDVLSPGTQLVLVSAAQNVYSPGCDLINPTTLYITDELYNSIFQSSNLSPGCDSTYQYLNTSVYDAPTSKLSDVLNFKVSTPSTPFAVGDKISYEFITGSNGFNTTNFTASILAGGSFSNQLSEYQVGSNPFATSSLSPFISGSLNNTLILNSSLSYFKDYLFMPTGSSPITENKLFNVYGDVDYNFSPKAGDFISIYYSGGYFESSILNAYSDISGKINLTVSSELPSNLTKLAFANGDITKFIILSKVNDETNLILTFDKKPGNTSLGFIIPNNLHPDVLDNIDVITKEVKQKLLDLGTNSGGGTF
jgi:hypothetical protein